MGNFLSGCSNKSDMQEKIALSLQKKFNNSFVIDDTYTISENDTLYWNSEEYDGRYLNVTLEELGKLYLQGSLPCNKNNLTIDDIISAYQSNPFIQSVDDFNIKHCDDVFLQKNKLNCSSNLLFGGGGNNNLSEFNIVNANNDIKYASDINSPTSSDSAYLHYKKHKEMYNNNQIGGNSNNLKTNNEESNIGGNSNNDLFKNKIYGGDIFSKHKNNLNKTSKNMKNNESISHSELSDLKRFIKNQQNNMSESSDNSNTVSTIEHLLKSTVTDGSSQSDSDEYNIQHGGRNKIPFFSTESMDVSYGF